jgi:hypothetical protein
VIAFTIAVALAKPRAFSVYPVSLLPDTSLARLLKWIAKLAASKRMEIPPKSLYGHLPEIPFHTLLQKARGQVDG